jgi:hypothetical protein
MNSILRCNLIFPVKIIIANYLEFMPVLYGELTFFQKEPYVCLDEW